MLAFMEQNLQRVLGDPSFGLPYWDWSVDGSLPTNLQPGMPIWQADAMGGQGNPVSNGKFAFNSGDPASFWVRIESGPGVTLRQTNRGLRRAFGVDAPSLPSALDVGAAFNTLLDPSLAQYDGPNFDKDSAGFRNRLEGFIGTGLHNQVHRWVGGDMGPASSPNDPIFYLHHANVDRVWEGWMVRNGRNYLPDMTAPVTLLGERIDDPIVSPLIGGMTAATPSTTLDVSANYAYDLLP
jgi:tyrosinase